jgi:hypothetical protein
MLAEASTAAATATPWHAIHGMQFTHVRLLKLRNVMSMSDSSIKLLRFVSDNVWGSVDRQFVFRHIAEYLVQAWDVRNTCKHSGAVLPFPSAPVGRGVDGIDAMA